MSGPPKTGRSPRPARCWVCEAAGPGSGTAPLNNGRSMPIETICQGCSRRLRVGDEHAGKKARCPQCGMIYVVPHPAVAGHVGPDADAGNASASGDATTEGTRGSSAEIPVVLAAKREPTDQPAVAGGGTPSRPDSGSQWFVRTADGTVYGPVARSELDQWVAEGRVPPSAMVREGGESWRPAGQRYPQLARAAPLSPQGNPFSDAAARSPAPRPAPRNLIPHRGGLVLAMGILGWLFCPVLGPFAWAMGSADLREMRAGSMDSGGSATTQIGMILGAVQTVLLIIIVAFICLGLTLTR